MSQVGDIHFMTSCGLLAVEKGKQEKAGKQEKTMRKYEKERGNMGRR